MFDMYIYLICLICKYVYMCDVCVLVKGNECMYVCMRFMIYDMTMCNGLMRNV